MKIEIYGIASSTGFELLDSLGGSLKSKNYKKDERREPILPLLIALCAIPFGFLLPAHSGEFAGLAGIYGILCFWGLWVAFCFLLHYLLYSFFLDSTSKQWHGCEHMAADLIRSRKEINLENLRKAKRVNFRCGTTTVLCQILPLFIILLLLMLLINNEMISAELFCLGSITFHVPGVLGVSYLLQKFVVTARPTEEQLKDALDVAETYTEFRGLKE